MLLNLKHSLYHRQIMTNNPYFMHHIAISVRDIEKSKKFYEKLGFIEVFDYFGGDPFLKIKHLSLNGFILEIFCYDLNKDSEKNTNTLGADLKKIGVKHFALKTENLKKTSEALTVLLGIEAPEIKKGRTEIDYFFIEDPDGVFVEFVQDDRDLDDK